MEKLKFIGVSIIVLVLVGLIGYWSITSMQSGSEHVTKETIKQLEGENSDLKKEIEDLTYELSVAESKIEELSLSTEKETTETKPSAFKYQEMIDKLQKLVDDGIHMKLKSRGSRVGTLQEFLNIYNDTSKKVDNDYGAGTKKAVIDFQKDLKITADGEAGPNTFRKMILWLKTQN